MASINNYLTQISNAVYGEDVRGSIHDAIQAINDENVTVLSTARQYRNAAQTASQAAVEAKEEATQAAESINNEITEIKSDLSGIEGFTDDIKEALLNCFRHIPFLDSEDEYYNDLYYSLYHEYPTYINDFSNASLVLRKYYNASGEPADSVTDFIDETYYQIESSKTYIWAQGFKGNNYIDSVLKAANCLYRVLFYDENKNFISRVVNSGYSNDFGYVEPRSFSFTTPSNAKYIRVSASQLPMGIIVEDIPDDLRLITLVLANTDDSVISSRIALARKVSVFRNGVDITQKVIYGPGTEKLSTDTDYENDIWRFAIFSVNADNTSPEYGDNRESTTRIFNNKAFFVKKGDILHFNSIKAGVRSEDILTGNVNHTSSWLVGTSDYTIN